jgi:hypothetical protein
VGPVLAAVFVADIADVHRFTHDNCAPGPDLPHETATQEFREALRTIR